MQSGYLAERQQLESVYKRRKVDIVYSQQPIQPLKAYYSPSEQINIVLQNSKHMVDLGKIQLFFRPIIKYNYSSSSLAEAAQWALLGITPIDASNAFFTMQSITFNGNQLMANPQTSLLRTRSIWQAYYNNFMSNTEKNGLHGKSSTSGYNFGGISQNKTSFAEIGTVAPLGCNITQGANPPLTQTGAVNAVMSQFEGFSYPRAIVNRLCMYNADFNLAQSVANPTYVSNEYFAQNCTYNADAIFVQAIGAGTNGSVLQAFSDSGADSGNVFPMLPLALTPSTVVYKAQQERFQDIRMRFLVTTVSPYVLPIFSNLTGTWSSVNATPNANVYSSTATVFQGTTNGAGQQGNNQTDIVAQKVSYGMSIQDQTPNGIGRATAIFPSSTSSTYVQNEQFCELSCELRELSMELDQIGMIPMDSTQVIIQLQLNQPQNVLSAYLPTGNFYGTAATATVDPTPASLVNVQQYLAGCLLSNKASYIVTDVCARIEYLTYPDESFAIVREMLRQPKPYQSVRQQIDSIPGAGQFTQRLSIGASSIINALVMFIVPNGGMQTTQAVNVGTAPYNTQLGRPQDTVINFQGCNPPGQGDLRSTYLDSYYMTMSSIYAEVDGRRYESMDIPLSNPELSTYLKTEAGVTTALGKYVDLDLREYLQNRFFYVVPINPNNDTSMMIHDQQIVVTLNINANSRVQSSALWNESSKTINNKFSLLTFAITHQALVDASYIKVL